MTKAEFTLMCHPFVGAVRKPPSPLVIRNVVAIPRGCHNIVSPRHCRVLLVHHKFGHQPDLNLYEVQPKDLPQLKTKHSPVPAPPVTGKTQVQAKLKTKIRASSIFIFNLWFLIFNGMSLRRVAATEWAKRMKWMEKINPLILSSSHVF